MRYEAVQLFVDRALSVQPSFAVTERNAAALAQVCRRLDGIPLAIELAAARVKALSLEQIAVRMDDFFRLLTGGSRTALPRQQTLRATIDWSYDLLSEPEKVLFRRLSVFASGWTLEAAEAVCGEGEGERRKAKGERERNDSPTDVASFSPFAFRLSPSDVLDLLTQLVNKSLVEVEEHGSAARYRMLDSIRQYARDKLLERGEAAALRGRHWEWFVALAEEAEPELHQPDQALWLARLETEHDNLRTALEWSLSGGSRQEADGSQTVTDEAADPSAVGPTALPPASCLLPTGPEAALRLAGALWPFWLMRGYLSEGRDWLERTLACASGGGERQTPDDMPPAALRTPRFATVLHAAGALACQQEDTAAARSLLQRSVALWRVLGDRREEASSMAWLGRVALAQTRIEEARTLLEGSLAVFREVGDQRGIARALNNLGEAARCVQEYDRAAALYIESLALSRETGHQAGIGIALHNLGQVALRQADTAEAGTRFHESLELFREIGDRRGIAACLAGLAAVALAPEPAPAAGAGRAGAERAVCLLGAAEAQLEAIGAPLPPADRAAYENSLAAARAALDAETFAALWSQGRAMDLEQAIAAAMREG